ncbi:MAG: DUF4184 family protein, partial [Steroidobacteraceae bacterium]
PLRRAPLLRTVPLIIGSMTPDVPYFLPWRIAKYIPQGATHTLLGTLTLDLPFGVMMLLFVWLLRVPLAAPLGPASQAKCLAAMERFGSRPLNWVLAPASLLIGSWTHLAWDSFTHPDGWMVSRISALSAPVSFFSYTGELCHVLQYASSVFGLAVIAAWFALLPTPKPAPAVRNGARAAGGPLLLALLLAIAAAVGGFETAEHLVRHTLASYHLFYLLLTRTTAWFALLYTVAGLLIARGRRAAAAAPG